MRGAKWLAVSALAMVLAASDAATGQPKQPFAASVRVLEIPGAVEAHATVDRFELAKRMAWRAGAVDEAVYQGTPESLLKMKLHADGPQAGPELVGALMRASEEDPQLGRPPMLWIAISSMTFRGVLESLATRCDAKQCEADIVLIQAQRALARAPLSEDPARSPGF